eukprot:TRINITY_DN7904_c0_g1_i1.p1 TRINITY_DN7904_c0_g1~~TRINITY_DN7904_c0_g1_i1.p1  ORF type:complete len:567 (+),score=128.02 TRINITY_DN7904_c0_g1_i1:21-1721(+)
MADAGDKQRYDKFPAFDQFEVEAPVVTAQERRLKTAVLFFVTLSIFLFFWGITATFFSPFTVPDNDFLPGGEAINFFHYNDVYEIEGIGYRWRNGGAARVSTVLQNLRQKDPSLIVTLGGDAISPSLLTNIFHGKHMIDVQNRLGLNYACLGNHEFDLGIDVLRERIRESNFEWLNSNLYLTDIGEPGNKILFPGTKEHVVLSKVLRISGREVKIGIFGLIYDFLATTKNQTGLLVSDPFRAATEQVWKLKQQNVTVIIALTHLPASEDYRIALENPDINLILGGHDHEAQVATQYGRTTLIKSTSDWRNAWLVQMIFSQDLTRGVTFKYLNQPINEDLVASDPVMVELIKEYKEAAGLTNEIVGVADEDFDTSHNSMRQGETNAGNFIAQAIKEGTGADVGMMNAGGVRSDTVYEKGYEFTSEDVMRMLPFGNMVVSVRINGSLFKAALEHGVGDRSDSGAFPTIDGVRVNYSLIMPTGKKICSIQFANGTGLKDDTTFILGLNDFLAAGGDGYSMFLGLQSFSVDTTIEQTVIDLMKRTNRINPPVDGRLNSVSVSDCLTTKAR